MSKYNDTKFYWLQMKEDFFEEDAINWLEEQNPNGKDYAYFYIKLCLKSLKSNGVLVRKVGKILVPYDNNKLAEMTKTDFDTVTVAMELLKKIGLVQILENGEIYMTQVENMIGSQSIGAFKKQQQRTIGGQLSTNRPPEIESEIEIDKDIEDDDLNNIYTQLKLKSSYFSNLSDSAKQELKVYKKVVKQLYINKNIDILNNLDLNILSYIYKKMKNQNVKNNESYFITSLINYFKEERDKNV